MRQQSTCGALFVITLLGFSSGFADSYSSDVACDNMTAFCLGTVVKCLEAPTCASILTLNSSSVAEDDDDLARDARGCMSTYGRGATEEDANGTDTTQMSTTVALSAESTAAPAFMCGPGCVTTFDAIQSCAFSRCTLIMIDCGNDDVCLPMIVEMQTNPRAAMTAEFGHPVVYQTLFCLDELCDTNFLAWASRSNGSECHYTEYEVTVLQAELEIACETCAELSDLALLGQSNSSVNVSSAFWEYFRGNVSDVEICQCLLRVSPEVSVLLGRCISDSPMIASDIIRFCNATFSELLSESPDTNASVVKYPSAEMCSAGCTSCSCTQLRGCDCPPCRERYFDQQYVSDETIHIDFGYDVSSTPKGMVEYMCFSDSKPEDISAFGFSHDVFRVDLSFISMGVLEKTTFISLQDTPLEQLILIHSNVSDIQGDVFGDLPSLRVLVLRSNGLTAIQRDTFGALSNLARLDLAENRIATIEVAAFQNLTALETLWLDNNHIASITPGMFRGLENLKFVRLESNQIAALSMDVFKFLTRIEVIQLSENRITSMPTAIVRGYDNLRLIRFDNNVLQGCYIDHGADGMPYHYRCSDCLGGVAMQRTVTSSVIQWCPPFSLSATAAKALSAYRKNIEKAVLFVGDTTHFEGINRTQEEVFQYHGGERDLISYFAFAVDDEGRPLDLPGDFCVGKLGQMTVAPSEPGSFNMSLVAKDSSGQEIVLVNWRMSVMLPTDFNQSSRVWPLELEASGNAMWINETTTTGNHSSTARAGGIVANIYAAPNATYRLLPPSDIITDKSSYFTHYGGADEIAFRIGSDQVLNVGSVLVDSNTGYVVFNFEELGVHEIHLIAFTDIASTPVAIGGYCRIVVHVLHEDVVHVAYGPNGLPCGIHGVPADDDNPFDQSYKCTCTSGFEGSNCDAESEVQQSSPVQQSTVEKTVMYITITVVVVVGIVLFAFISYRRKRINASIVSQKPHDFSADASDFEILGLAMTDSFQKRTPEELKRARITVLNEIGSGEYGRVHKGIYCPQGQLSYEVALKVLKDDATGSDLKSLHREALITAQFMHTNVVGLVGVVTAGSPVMLVLQYCANGSLKSTLQQRRDELTLHILLSYCKDVARGMHYLAKRKFVHRDLAARNVLVDSAENAKVADFGLSREVQDAEYYKSADSDAKVPIRWTSPEALNHQRYSEKSDVWAFGVTCVEVFTCGKTPYRGWLNSYVIEQVNLGYRLPRPDACPPLVFDAVIAPCFETGAEDRPTFGEIVDVAREIEISDCAAARHSIMFDDVSFGSEPPTREASAQVLDDAPTSAKPRVMPAAQDEDEDPQYLNRSDTAAAQSQPPSLYSPVTRASVEPDDIAIESQYSGEGHEGQSVSVTVGNVENEVVYECPESMKINSKTREELLRQRGELSKRKDSNCTEDGTEIEPLPEDHDSTESKSLSSPSSPAASSDRGAVSPAVVTNHSGSYESPFLLGHAQVHARITIPGTVDEPFVTESDDGDSAASDTELAVAPARLLRERLQTVWVRETREQGATSDALDRMSPHGRVSGILRTESGPPRDMQIPPFMDNTVDSDYGTMNHRNVQHAWQEPDAALSGNDLVEPDVFASETLL